MSKCSVCGSDNFLKPKGDEFVLGKLERVGSKIRMDDRNLLPVRIEVCNECKHIDFFLIKV